MYFFLRKYIKISYLSGIYIKVIKTAWYMYMNFLVKGALGFWPIFFLGEKKCLFVFNSSIHLWCFFFKNKSLNKYLMYTHNYLTHLNQNNIENLDISKSFLKNVSYVSAYLSLFLTVEMSICVLACMFSFSRGQSLRVHMYTLYIESHFNSSTCVHDYFDGMAKLQTYQHYFIHPPSTHIDLIAKYAKWTILIYYFIYYTKKSMCFKYGRLQKTHLSGFFFLSDFGQWLSDINNKIIMRQRSNNI